MTLSERVYNGDRAREVLENEVFQQAFAEIQQELIDQWQELPSTEGTSKARDRLHLSLTMLGKVKSTLERTLADGKLAMEDLKHQRTLAERARDAKSAFFSE